MKSEFIELEELEIEDKEFERIVKCGFKQLSYPAITITKYAIYFNRLAGQYAPQRIAWATTPNYVVALPADDDDKNAYSIRVHKTGDFGVTAFPVVMRKEKKIAPGVYKIYKYTNGIAFKRYEPEK